MYDDYEVEIIPDPEEEEFDNTLWGTSLEDQISGNKKITDKENAKIKHIKHLPRKKRHIRSRRMQKNK